MIDIEKSLPYIKTAADHKYAEAFFSYGVELVENTNNLSDGIKYIKIGVDLEDMNFMYYYGHFLLDGLRGVKKI